MKLVSYVLGRKTRLGALIAGGKFVADLNRASRERLRVQAPGAGLKRPKPLPAEMIEFLEGGDAAMQTARETVEWVARETIEWLVRETESGAINPLVEKRIIVPASKAKLAAPVPRPPKLIAVWVNYYEHEKEVALHTPIAAPKKAPLFFTKFPTAVIGPGEPIVLPRISHKVDYEAELALVIGKVVGKRGKDIAPENAYEHIAGYTIMNDVSARDFSLRELLGVAGPSDVQKSFDTFAPMGPYLVTRDEVPDPQSLGIRLRIGDEILQDSNTRFMIHKIPEIIAYISSIATLEPGDVISTGTPAGVGFTRTPPRWLRPGETVRIEIDRIGVLENPVVAED